MVRVPTYSTYINMMNGALKNKQLVDQYSFQSITGLKSQTYSGLQHCQSGGGADRKQQLYGKQQHS